MAGRTATRCRAAERADRDPHVRGDADVARRRARRRVLRNRPPPAGDGVARTLALPSRGRPRRRRVLAEGGALGRHRGRPAALPRGRPAGRALRRPTSVRRRRARPRAALPHRRGGNAEPLPPDRRRALRVGRSYTPFSIARRNPTTTTVRKTTATRTAEFAAEKLMTPIAAPLVARFHYGGACRGAQSLSVVIRGGAAYPSSASSAPASVSTSASCSGVRSRRQRPTELVCAVANARASSGSPTPSVRASSAVTASGSATSSS